MGDNLLNAEDLHKFLKNNVLTNFEGFTVIDDVGGWSNNIFKGKILIIIHSGSDIDNKRIENLRSEFINQFGHKSIFRVDQLYHSSY